MTQTLTEQLENVSFEESRYYYIKDTAGIHRIAKDVGSVFIDGVVRFDKGCNIEILAPVPTSEEWEELNVMLKNASHNARHYSSMTCRLEEKLKIAREALTIGIRMCDEEDPEDHSGLGRRLKEFKERARKALAQIDELKGDK